jgi:hypothetical protein
VFVDDVSLYRLDTIGNGIADEEDKLFSLSIYPNPAHHDIHVSTVNFTQVYDWNLYDVSGRLIQSYSISKREQDLFLPEPY